MRRRILELLADGERTSGAITDVIRAEFGLSQPGVSQHLRVLRDSGFASVRAEGARRFYAVEPTPLSEVDIHRGFSFDGFPTAEVDPHTARICSSRCETVIRPVTAV